MNWDEFRNDWLKANKFFTLSFVVSGDSSMLNSSRNSLMIVKQRWSGLAFDRLLRIVKSGGDRVWNVATMTTFVSKVAEVYINEFVVYFMTKITEAKDWFCFNHRTRRNCKHATKFVSPIIVVERESARENRFCRSDLTMPKKLCWPTSPSRNSFQSDGRVPKLWQTHPTSGTYASAHRYSSLPSNANSIGRCCTDCTRPLF